MMLNPNDEKWISIAEFDKDGEIKFTDEYIEATNELGGGARKFAAHLISHWDKEFASMLDYFGPVDANEDWYTGVDGDPMDVQEDAPDRWEYLGIPFEGLDVEWYRDIMRAKLVTMKIPEKLITQFIKVAKKEGF